MLYIHKYSTRVSSFPSLSLIAKLEPKYFKSLAGVYLGEQTKVSKKIYTSCWNRCSWPLQKEVRVTVCDFKWTVFKLLTFWLRECFPVTDWLPYIFQSTFTFIISVMVSTGSEAGVKNFPVFTKVSGRAENVTHTSVFQSNAPSSTSHCPSTKCLICHFYIDESYCVW